MANTQRYKGSRAWIVWIVWVAAAIAGFVGSAIYIASRATPPRDATTLAAFMKVMPVSQTFELRGRDGVKYIEVLGEEPWAIFVTGPGMYIFNANGELVEWTNDSLDDGAFVDKWRGGRLRTRLPVDDLRK